MVFHSHRLTVQLTIHGNTALNNATQKTTLERSCSFQGQTQHAIPPKHPFFHRSWVIQESEVLNVPHFYNEVFL